MPDRPKLKQFGHLTPDDLASHPVWVSCHSVDYDEPWYDDTENLSHFPKTGIRFWQKTGFPLAVHQRGQTSTDTRVASAISDSI